MDTFNSLLGQWYFVCLLAFLVLTSIWWYFLPAWIASRKQAHDKKAIFFVNLLYGWTVIGWFISLHWALSSRDHRVPGRTYPFYLFPWRGWSSEPDDHRPVVVAEAEPADRYRHLAVR